MKEATINGKHIRMMQNSQKEWEVLVNHNTPIWCGDKEDAKTKYQSQVLTAISEGQKLPENNPEEFLRLLKEAIAAQQKFVNASYRLGKSMLSLKLNKRKILQLTAYALDELEYLQDEHIRSMPDELPLEEAQEAMEEEVDENVGGLVSKIIGLIG